MEGNLKNKIKKIKLLILDVDGVLTNGKINFDERGKEIKVFDVQDGFGLVFFKQAGFKTAIISARSAGAVTVRAKDLKFDEIHQDAYPKTSAYQKVLKNLKVKDEETCFMGDDLPDLCLLSKVGFSVAPANGVDDVKKRVDYVTKRKGGDGAVREVVELILRTQGKWKNVMKGFV
ncbi:3-deoxy-D-manno-octulosonate 8-phosphate phosphatase [hydrothermal vent metagenome]|uniref:3-deoxy-D-manno-octulosonate 8-phosphate phosphatase KdsC n=1 Tax=hydrothermal vent metagenome TaxID=652676 RepID=A0A3B1DUA4_9ZZZZ